MARPRKPMARARSARGRRRRGSGWPRARLPATSSRVGRRASQAPPSTTSTPTATSAVTAVPATGPATGDGPPSPLRPAFTTTATTIPASRNATRTVRTIGSGSGPCSRPDTSGGRDPSGSSGCHTSLMAHLHAGAQIATGRRAASGPARRPRVPPPGSWLLPILLRAALQEVPEPGLVQDGYPQLGGPSGLGAGIGADDDVGGLLGDAGGDPAAAVLDGPGRLLPGEAVQPAGEHERHPGQGLGQLGPAGVAVGLG